jgi:hypothetical protein
MSKKKPEQKPIVMPIGKFKGRALSEILDEEPSYMAWFYDTVDGFEEVKQAIAALPDFPAKLAKYRERKQIKDKALEQRIEEVVSRMFAVEPSPAEVDDLCERLFHSQN